MRDVGVNKIQWVNFKALIVSLNIYELKGVPSEQTRGTPKNYREGKVFKSKTRKS